MSELGKRKFTSVRKVTSVPKTFRPWKEFSVGDIVLGKYVAEHKDQYDKVGTVVEVYEHWLKDKKADYVGKNLVLNATGMLSKAMQNVQLGEVIQVTYQGTAEIEKGKFAGKDSHVVLVEVMAEDDTTDEVDL